MSMNISDDLFLSTVATGAFNRGYRADVGDNSIGAVRA